MLGQIEAAFAERTASEGRLRRFVADATSCAPAHLGPGLRGAVRRGAWKRPDDLATVLRRIEEEAARMGVLVDDLLLLARLDQGRPLEQAPIDLSRAAADAVEDARAGAGDRAITLDAGRKVLLLGDAGRLHQVAANLLANAVQHTPPGTPIHVTVSAVDQTAVLEVADEGPGLSAEAAERAFERFYRSDTSRARARRERSRAGHGLGLAIVAALVHLHGGSVGLASSPGAGATFRVELPIPAPGAVQPPYEPRPRTTDSQAPRGGAPSLRN